MTVLFISYAYSLFSWHYGEVSSPTISSRYKCTSTINTKRIEKFDEQELSSLWRRSRCWLAMCINTGEGVKRRNKLVIRMFVSDLFSDFLLPPHFRVKFYNRTQISFFSLFVLLFLSYKFMLLLQEHQEFFQVLQHQDVVGQHFLPTKTEV